jgi:hypothetical protein
MASGHPVAETTNYTGWLVGGGVIVGVLIVAALLWVHYHG